MNEIYPGEQNRCYLCGEPIPDEDELCEECTATETQELGE